MCDYHHKKLCFHPDKVGAGQVAIGCDVHDCMYCTDKEWQKHHIRRDIEYFSSLLTIAKQSVESLETNVVDSVHGSVASDETMFRDPRVSPLAHASPSRLFRGI
ncbi:MAG: hypothetical protein ACOCU6_00995 [Nanoarchaeota archaeon]